MKKVKNENISREVILTESRTMRDEYMKEESYDILDKIKAIPYLTKDMVVSVEQVANYYEVSKKTIETIISRHKGELVEDGIMTLKGANLKELRRDICLLHGEETKIIGKRSAKLTILTKRAMLKIAFYLQNNRISDNVKRGLLEENPTLYKEFEEATSKVCYKKRYEKGFEDLFYPLLGKYNEIKKQVVCGEYFIDYTINNKIAIEIDEDNHNGYDAERERKRTNFILENGYVLFRYNTQENNVLEFIGEIIWCLHNEDTNMKL